MANKNIDKRQRNFREKSTENFTQWTNPILSIFHYWPKTLKKLSFEAQSLNHFGIFLS